jgi:hypothetical protein
VLRRIGVLAALAALAALTGCMGDGVFVVGTAKNRMPAGTYVSFGNNDCYWTRLSGFHGTNVDETIADGITDGPVVVDIAPTDVGFSTERCGTWTKVA